MGYVWNLGGLRPGELTQRVLKKASDDDVLGQSAKLSYYLILATFPLLIFLVALFGLLAPGSDMLQKLLAYWRQVLPPAAYELIITTLQEVSAKTGSGKISISLIGTIWAASAGMSAIVDGLNRAYAVKEGRPWWKAQLLSVVLTLALSIFIVMALGIILYGDRIGEFAATQIGLGSQFQAVWNVVQWPIGLAFVLLAFVLLYRFAPDLHEVEWHHVTPGGIVAVILWLAVSMALRLYLHYFNHYGATYGSLGAVIILMLWFYLTGAAILIGGEMNAVIENAAARRGAPDARLPGEKEPGEKQQAQKG